MSRTAGGEVEKLQMEKYGFLMFSLLCGLSRGALPYDWPGTFHMKPSDPTPLSLSATQPFANRGIEASKHRKKAGLVI